jgi:ABC-type branched-subunit amino acid transport system permease subunit
VTGFPDLCHIRFCAIGAPVVGFLAPGRLRTNLVVGEALVFGPPVESRVFGPFFRGLRPLVQIAMISMLFFQRCHIFLSALC